MEQKKEETKLSYFDVKTEVIAPIEVHYKVLAKDVDEAVKKVKEGKVRPTFISKPKDIRKIKRIMVFITGTINKLYDKTF